MSFAGRTIRAFLLDVTGVLYDGKSSIEGSIRALERYCSQTDSILCSNHRRVNKVASQNANELLLLRVQDPESQLQSTAVQ